MEAIRLETTVRDDGSLLVPELEIGEQVEVIVLRTGRRDTPNRIGGWAKGKIRIMPGFDDPIPGMEDYQ